jgi:hypothetical protein
MDRAWAARGVHRWTLAARERATGRLAGFTDVVWSPDAPQILNQMNTGVLPEYPGRSRPISRDGDEQGMNGGGNSVRLSIVVRLSENPASFLLATP